MTRKPRETYSSEFKQEAVVLLEQGDKPASQLARELGVRRNQLYKWKAEIEEHGTEAFPGKGGRPKNQSSELAQMKTELKKLREENEILKKAAMYFARESQ